MDAATLDEALRAGDVDELLRLVDACCASRDWTSLESVRARCELAQETGHQLWPAASHAAYRLALEAPAPFAAAVLVEGTGRFAPGPLSEVAAQLHTWDELGPEVPASAPAMLAAHERVVRGEDLSDRLLDGPTVLDLPMRLAPWEPEYALAEYHEHDGDFPAPVSPSMTLIELPTPPVIEALDDAAVALRDAVRVWAEGSNGIVEVVSVVGGTTDAIAALSPSAARAARVAPGEAFAHLAWAGASGGAFGRRPGAATGRFAAWWVGAAVGGLLDEWPPDPSRLGQRVGELDWVLWEAAEPMAGWKLRLAVEDPARGRAWALRALDSR